MARLLQVKWALGMEGGALICNPFDGIPAAEMESAIHTALTECEQQRRERQGELRRSSCADRRTDRRAEPGGEYRA